MSDTKPEKSKVKVFYEDSAAVSLLTASGLVSRGPIRLESIIVTAGTGNGQLGVYDNTNASGNLRLFLETVQNNSSQFLYFGHVKFERGLYLDFVTGISHVTVVYWVDLD